MLANSKIGGGYNIQIIRPKLTPREVWSKYGFPLVSKETAKKISNVRINPNSKVSQIRMGSGRFALPHKWRFLINEPYDTHCICCDKLKKEPFHRFEKETDRRPIIGVMADESRIRRGKYLHNGGCNVFGEKPSSRPLSIWTEADIWEYIRQNNIKLADIYDKGAHRTGCVGCGFGAQFSDDNRFKLLLDIHPKLYDMVMNYTNNGVTFREALRKVLAVNNLYLPDEEPKNLFNYEQD